MKSTTSQERAKHPAKRGDVLIGSGCRNNSSRTEAKSLRLSVEESRLVMQNALAAGMTFSDYCRDRLLEGSKVSRETALILAEQGRTRELLTRFQAMNSAGGPTEAQIAEAIDRVEALDPRLLIARAMGVK